MGHSNMPRRRSMLSGAIKESRLARVRRGLILIQKGEGGDKGGDSSLYLGWRLEVEEGWRNEAGARGGCLENNGLLAVDWRIEVVESWTVYILVTRLSLPSLDQLLHSKSANVLQLCSVIGER